MRTNDIDRIEGIDAPDPDDPIENHPAVRAQRARIAATRERLAEEVDEIEDRLAPDQVAETLKDRVLGLLRAHPVATASLAGALAYGLYRKLRD